MSEIDRRTFIKGAGVATGVAATGAGASTLDLEPVEEAEAIAPAVLAGVGIAAGGVALGWALREYEVIGSNPPPEGLTADALKQDVYETTRTRKSTNASTIVDNQNILKGIQNTAYVEGKLAAIEQLNAEATQQAVQDAAIAAVDTYATTVQKNLLKTWNEAANELQSLLSTVRAHSDVTVQDVFTGPSNPHGSDRVYQDTLVHTSDYSADSTSFDVTHTLPDGTEMEVAHIESQYQDSAGDMTVGYDIWTPTAKQDSNDYGGDIYRMDVIATGADFSYMDFAAWNGIYAQMTTDFQSVRDGLITWVDSIYGQVQSGDIEVSDLITPRERAAMMTDDGKYPQAVADLVALNVPVDLEREATVSLDYLQQDVTLRGTLGITSPPSSLESGTTYNPSADNLGSVYLTYDVGTGEGVWTQYDDAKGVDGGIVEFEAEPYEGVTYRIATNYDETAEVTKSDFTEGTDGSSNTVWTVDVSGQLENSIAQIEEVTYVTKTEETRYETIQIEGDFTIQKFMNRETGEEASSASFESTEPQTDSNYVTQDEWDQMVQQNKELIEKYEDAQSGAGGGWFGEGGGGSLGIIALGVAAIGAIFALGQSNDN